MNIEISTDFDCFKPLPTNISKRLNLRKGTFWILCLAEIIDMHKHSRKNKTKSVEPYELLMKKLLLLDNKFKLNNILRNSY